MGLTQRMCSRQHAHTMWVSSSFLLTSLLFSCSSAALRHQQGLRAPPPSSSGSPPPDSLWFQQMLGVKCSGRRTAVDLPDMHRVWVVSVLGHSQSTLGKDHPSQVL